MKKLCLLICFLVVLSLNVIMIFAQECSEGQIMVNGQCGEVTLSALQDGWNRIDPAGETVCAHDTMYSYWVRPGESNNLLVYFQGGGGCWNAETCRDDGRAFNGFYDSVINGSDHPQTRRGILDFDNPENPFADYTVLYIPVCTGDVHWGDNVTDFDGSDVTMRYKGFVNASVALEWAYENVINPDSVFVTGCSAGSVGSIVHIPFIIEQYPEIPIYQLGDSLSLIMEGSTDLQSIWRNHDTFPQWIPELQAMEPEEWTMAKQYIATANHYPNYIFSQFNTARDQVQVFYTYLDNSRGDDWEPLLDAHLETIEQNAPNYRSFTAGGNLHCITPSNSFYSYSIDGIRLRDWVADMANGISVESLHCEDCSRAETIR